MNVIQPLHEKATFLIRLVKPHPGRRDKGRKKGGEVDSGRQVKRFNSM